MVFFTAKKTKKKTKGSKITTGLAVVGALAVAGIFVPDEDVKEIPEDPPAIEETVNIEQPTIEETIEQVVPQESEANPPEPAPVPEEKEEVEKAPVSTPAAVETEPVVEPEPVVEVDPEQAFRDSLKQYFLVGSSDSDKYHTPSCKWNSKINNSNLVHFDSFEEAEAAGYEPCGTCKPK